MQDLIIIGSGPSGMTAALYALRSNLKVTLIEKGLPGGQMNNTLEIENYPGYESILGPELSEKMFEPLDKLGVNFVFGEVTKLTKENNTFKVYLSDEVLESKSVIIATGAKHRLLNIKGEEELSGRGVSYCAVCDGAFFKGEDLVLVGGGDSAVEETLYLSKLAKSVTIIHRRDQLRAQKILQEKAFNNDKIKFIWDSVVEEIKGENKVNSVVLKNVKTNEVSTLETAGVFIYVGLDPINDFAKELNITNEEGWIETQENLETSISGLFAVGDIRNKKLRQVTTAVGDGVLAAQSAYEYLEELNG